MYIKTGLILIGILLAILVFNFFDLSKIIAVLSTSNLYLIFLAFLVQFAIIMLIGLRLWFTAYRYSCPPYVSYLETLKITIIGWTVNMLTPLTKIGGEPSKIYLYKKKGMYVSDASAIVMIDSFTDIATMYFVAILATIAMFFFGISLTILIPFVIAIVVTLAIIASLAAVILHPTALNKLVNWLMRKISKYKQIDIKDYAANFQKAIKIIFSDRTLLKGIFSIAFLMRILEFIRLWLIFVAIGLVLPPQIVVFAWTFLFVLAMIPWLPGGLGLMEAGGIVAFILLGIPKAIAGSAILIERILSFWLVIAIGFIVIWRMKIKIKL